MNFKFWKKNLQEETIVIKIDVSELFEPKINLSENEKEKLK